MDFNSFQKMVQTFGACRARWETKEFEAASAWAETPRGADIIRSEQKLDERLNLFRPPVCAGLSDRLYAALLNERTQRQFLFILRYSTWLSLLFMIGGFCLGWYQTRQVYINTQSYFDTLFDINY